MLVGLFVVFFFFKQKTAYEMRISDWSSDVCSSDLSAGAAAGQDASGADADRDAPGARTSLETFRPLFEPKTVAVLGASTKDVSIANTFIRSLKDFGYAGVIYPIHPQAAEVEGLKAYPRLAATPDPIESDYAYLGAHRLPAPLGDARCPRRHPNGSSYL